MFASERIRTIGDGYMTGSGLPEPSTDHAHNTVRVALRVLRYTKKIQLTPKNGSVALVLLQALSSGPWLVSKNMSMTFLNQA